MTPPSLPPSDNLARHASEDGVGPDCVEPIGSSGFVAAAFRHRTSRAADPRSTPTFSSPISSTAGTTSGARSTSVSSERMDELENERLKKLKDP